ncbi:MAG: hypothetical protein Q9160_003806 [Pyrenula sp. 1 TL-2023]
MTYMDRKQFLERFVFSVAEDFKSRSGEPASWAKGHPKTWGDEDAVIETPDVPERKPFEYSTLNLAVSDDKRLLAVSKRNMIFVYDVETRQLKSELKGHETNVRTLAFQPQRHSNQVVPSNTKNPENTNASNTDDTYLLMSAGSHASGADPILIIWELLPTGHLVPNDLDEAPNIASLASLAVESLLPTLRTTSPDLTPQDLVSIASSLQSPFHSAISSTLTAHTLHKHQSVLPGASLPSFTPIPSLFHPTRPHSLYLTHNKTTQSGPRPPAQLPQVHIYNPSSTSTPITPLQTLSGHTDYITWAGFSPLTGRYLATVSWDGSAYIFDLEDSSPETGHSFSTGVIENPRTGAGGQAWCAAFSADEKYVAVSAAMGRVVVVYDLASQKAVATFPHDAEKGYEKEIKVRNWVRNMAWSPVEPSDEKTGKRQTLLLGTGVEAYLWDPFAPANTITTTTSSSSSSAPSDSSPPSSSPPSPPPPQIPQHYSLSLPLPIMRTFASFLSVSHDAVSVPVSKNVNEDTLDNHRPQPAAHRSPSLELITLLCGDGTFECWNPERNVKWRFQRPKGEVMEWANGGVEVLRGGKLVSLDGDGRVRFWGLGVGGGGVEE